MDPSPTELFNNKSCNQSKSQDYGSRLLPQVVDELAFSDPHRIYGTFPQSSDLSSGFRDVTMLEMSQAIDRAAHWLEGVVGRSTQFETIAYMGLSDLRYAIIFLAAVKCGYKLLVPSIRNSTWMNVSLFEQTGCKKFLYAVELSLKIQTLKDAVEGLESFSVAPLDDLLRGEGKPYPFNTTYRKARWDPVLICHSSGSTGPPKPVVTNHASWAVIDNDRNLSTVKGRKTQSFATFNWNGEGGRYYAAFPPFHLGGFVAYVALPIYSSQATVVLGPADRPPTGQVAFHIMQRFQIKALFCPPSIFEQLVQEDAGLELAKGLDFILYAGGPLSTGTGSKLSQVTEVCQFYGSTEAGAAQTLIPGKEDWEYLEWHPNYGADMQPSEDDAFELVLHKDQKYDGIRALDCNFRDIDDWHTKDLFRPHPSKPHLWKFHSRLDDIIVLSNGLKFNPNYSETAIGTHPLLSGALIIGQGRFLAALLIEPKEGTSKAINLIEAIWPAVEKANEQAPGYGRIIRPMILVASEEKRFERAGKGTVIRGMTIKKFATEIDSLYSSENTTADGPKLAAEHDLDSIRGYVRACIQTSFSPADLHDDQDLYVSGLDSLKTVEIAALLKAGVKDTDLTWISPQFIYANPTIDGLANVLFKNSSGSVGVAERGANGTDLDCKEKMASMVDEFTRNLEQRSFGNAALPGKTQRKVLLTGSTGSLGGHILRALLQDLDISHVTCVNRSANGRERQLDIFQKLGSRQELLTSSKVEFLQVSYGEHHLGLPAAQYEQLLSSVDVIIHNAWKVDFNHSLESFRQVHVQGVRNLIDFCIHSQRNPHLIFLSSISSVGRWATLQPNGNSPPEEIVSDYKVAHEMGYAESKLVAENILHRASQAAGIPVSILRVGQIAGPVDSPGVWNEQEWVPALIKTSKALKVLPDYIPDPDWIPVDLLARIVLDISRSTVTQGKAGFYNVVNPNKASWKALIPPILSRLGPKVRTVGLGEWSRMLEQVNSSNPKELIDKPAAKILPFFREIESGRGKGRVGHNTAKGVAASETMAGLKPVNAEWMELWLKQWGY